MMRHEMEDRERLLKMALEAKKRAYAPYSGFFVGASLWTEGGEIFSGCNVENVSFGLTVCAERVALWNAVAAGKRRFEALLVVADGERPVAPCGACRQVYMEFAPEIHVYMYNTRGEWKEMKMNALLPESFSLKPTGESQW